MTRVIQLLIYGLQVGSIYSLLAIGYTLVYGIIKMINMAHADFMMLGAFAALFLYQWVIGSGKPLLAVIFVCICTMLIVASIGLLVERLAYKPLRSRSSASTLVAAIGVAMFIENFMRALPSIGALPRSFPTLFSNTNIRFAGVQVSVIQLIVIGISLLLMLGMELLVSRSKIGKQMLAVSADKDAAALMGINVNKVISITFFLGAALAAICGILYASVYPTIYVYMAATIGNKAFISAVLGGIGNIKGAMLGGMILGILEVTLQSFASSISYGVSFVILIIILVYKPSGLLGNNVRDKV